MLTSCLEKLRLDIPCTCGDFRALWNLFFLFFLPSSKGEFILCFSPSIFSCPCISVYHPSPLALSLLPLYLCLPLFSPCSWSLGRPGCSYFGLTKTLPPEFVLWIPVAERFQEDLVLPSTGTGATIPQRCTGLGLLPQRDGLLNAWQLLLLILFARTRAGYFFHSSHPSQPGMA